MKRNKMLKMLEAGVNPIDVSIVKWEEILRYVKRSQYERAYSHNENCALCYVYNRLRSLNCPHCPLKSCSDDSPYSKIGRMLVVKNVQLSNKEHTKKEIITATENMIKALQRCKKDEV